MNDNREALIEKMTDAYRNYLLSREDVENMEYIFSSMEVYDERND